MLNNPDKNFNRCNVFPGTNVKFALDKTHMKVLRYLLFPLLSVLSISTFAQKVDTAHFQRGTTPEINLNRTNIPKGSVTVLFDDERLKENVDYLVDYAQGKLIITNLAVANAGKRLRIQLASPPSGTQPNSKSGPPADDQFNKSLYIGNPAYTH